jgi:hypothetical protein
MEENDMPPKKANEAYFADVFNRPMMTFCNADGSQHELGYIPDFDPSWIPNQASDAIVAYDIAKGSDCTAIMSKGISSAITCTTEELKDEISAIAARLAALESQLEKKNARNNLRLALKTLNYTREL